MKKTIFLLLCFLLQCSLGVGAATAKTKAVPSAKVKKPATKAIARKSPSPVRVRTITRYAKQARPKSAAVIRGKRLVSYSPRRARINRYAPVLSAGDLAGLNLTQNPLGLKSNVALILDELTSLVLFEKNSRAILPIASITKLMTALVVLEAKQDMDEVLTVTKDDIDHIKYTSSRLPIGARLSRSEMLHIALMSSENRAASALGHHYPGGLPAFVEAMNAHAALLGMTDTHYVEPTGLSSKNVSSARDLAKLVIAAQNHPLIKAYSTEVEYAVSPGGPKLEYINSNRLVRGSDWDIVLQKTGYIAEAGRCLVMKAIIEGRSVVMVFLDSKGKFSRASDANRVRLWLEKEKLPSLTQTAEEIQG